MPVDQYLKEWLSDKSLWKKMEGAFMQKGGWEGWAQVEFGLFLTNKNYYKSVQREVAGIFKSSSDRADLLCEGDTGAKNWLKDVIELKTETLFQSGGGKDDFKKRVEGDIVKLESLASPYASKEVRTTAIGISIAMQTTNDVKIAWGNKMNCIDVYAKSGEPWHIAAFYLTRTPG